MLFNRTAAGVLLLLSGLSMSPSVAQTPIPDALAAPGESVVLRVNADGDQVYDCKTGADGKLAWVLRGPMATLTERGEIIGYHYPGPTWELRDGSAVVGKVAASVPGATPNDIPWLKLDVASQRGNGLLSGVTTVLRINTQGGKPDGPCEADGASRKVPYTAEYLFLRKA
jgi:Protein of unknown function (DUF3455)